MIRKWKMHIRNPLIRIGLKSSILILLLMMQGCWEKNYDHWYTITVKNSTDRPLVLVEQYERSIYNDTLRMDINETVSFKDGSGLFFNEGDATENIMEDLFYAGGNTIQESVELYGDDTLVVTWLGPGRELGDSIHYFFNYSSWEFIPEDEYFGEIRFTIVDEDFLMGMKEE